jgi:hypothetical protein
LAELNLTQAEADALIALEKRRVDSHHHEFPRAGSLSIPLESANRREQFLLDIGRGRIDLHKVSYQNRARQVVVLLRLDVGGPPHRNPDDTEVSCPHLHVYREGYGSKWAFPVPSDKFSNPGNMWQALQDFMQYCNITEPPIIDPELFM